MKNKVKPLPSKKTNKSGFPRIKFVALASKYLISRLTWSRDYVSLEISKKRGLSNNLDIHHSKVPSSGKLLLVHKVLKCSILSLKQHHLTLVIQYASIHIFVLSVCLFPLNVKISEPTNSPSLGSCKTGLQILKIYQIEQKNSLTTFLYWSTIIKLRLKNKPIEAKAVTLGQSTQWH